MEEPFCSQQISSFICALNIEMRHHLIREKVESKEIAITYVSTKDMVAYGLTKALDPKPFKAFQAMIGMHWTGSQKMTEWESWKCSHVVPDRECIPAPSLVSYISALFFV